MGQSQFSAKVYDQKHQQRLIRYKNRLDQLFNIYYRAVGIAAKQIPVPDPKKPLKLSDYPAIEKRIEKMLEGLAFQVQSMVTDGIDEEILLSEEKNRAMIESLASYYGWSKEHVSRLNRRSIDARKAFKERTEEGMNLSGRVWDFLKFDKQKLEWALDLCLVEGISAAKISQEVRSFLKEPNKLFRRVRDKHGNLVLSKAAREYHPGQGVYRSSYKNALRLAATETNIAYRSADHEAWNQMPFVIGIKIQLSSIHAVSNVQGKKYPERYADMCDELVGIYPKGFKFVGFHPWCRCVAIAILAPREEMRKYTRLSYDDQETYHFKGEIQEMPRQFDAWIKANEDRIANAKQLPYFIRDNYVAGNPKNPLKFKVK